mmetsp:Transcript_32302/g.99957  ORF Transcript_32302/g.99957 Transcript_32302/m.99957 type:complete len:458 (-) Transcript_32302:32-1405(-)
MRCGVLAALAVATAAALRPLPLRIDGRWYDAAEYADRQHVGGRWLVEYARGRDVSFLFKSIHSLNEEKARGALELLPEIAAPDDARPYAFSLGDAPDAVEVDTPLRRDLRAMVRRRFGADTNAAKATTGQWLRIGLASFLTLSCWARWAAGDVVATALLPFSAWLLVAHTAHDATHGSLSARPWVNYWFQFTAHPLFFNVFVWIPQHLISHHQFTNEHDFDVDLHHFAPARLSPEASYDEGSDANRAWTFCFKGCLTTLGTSLLQPLRTVLAKPTPNFDVNITPVPDDVSKRVLAASMAPTFAALFYPLLAFGVGGGNWGLALFSSLWPFVGASLIWTAMTQTSHVQAACHDATVEDDCWTARQIAHSYDYSVARPRERAVVAALTAGLNMQSLHHALPTIAQSRLPALYDEYAEIAARHGAAPRTSKNLLTASGELLDFVFETNAPVVEAAVPVAR